MGLTRIQKTFIRLATYQQSYWSTLGRYRTKRRKHKKFDKWQPNQVKLEVINAVTGETTTAKAFEESKAKLKKWLKLRNIRAELTEMLLKKNSTWFKFEDEEFEDFPVILKIGSYKVPYLVRHVKDRKTFKGKTTCTVLLETTDNVDYLEILSTKKELLEKGKKKKKKGSK
jgi:hypothetical protein